jgi:galacturonosyltransferase 12/13/14/15
VRLFNLTHSLFFNQLFPNLNKVVFLDDDIVVQRDLSPLWAINLEGKVNGAVETCRGEDSWVMSKRFRTYFNFSHPVIARSLDPDECAWAYGMNIFDLAVWRKTNIRDTYHFWLKEVMHFTPTYPFPSLTRCSIVRLLCL